MSGQESLAQSFMVLSFASAGLIGMGHVLDGNAQSSSQQPPVQRALTKSPVVLTSHKQFARLATAYGGPTNHDSLIASSRLNTDHEVLDVERLADQESEQSAQRVVSQNNGQGSAVQTAVDQNLSATSATQGPDRAVLDEPFVRSTFIIEPEAAEQPIADESDAPLIVQTNATVEDVNRQQSDDMTTLLDTSQRRDESRDAELSLARQAFDDLRPKLLELTQEMASQAPSSRIVVDLSDRKVTLWHDGELAETFPIAVGRAGWETPTGEFEVINKNENPVWQNPLTDQIVPAGPNNPLGTRWIGFWTDGRNQIGFHGTIQTDLIGQAVSHGCIRMDNQDIEVLYDQIAIGVPVVISE